MYDVQKAPNKVLAKKAHGFLKDLGHKIPLGHVYELFSRLTVDANWNVASKKNVDFTAVLQSALPPELVPEEGLVPWTWDVCEDLELAFQILKRMSDEDKGFDIHGSPYHEVVGGKRTPKPIVLEIGRHLSIMSMGRDISLFQVHARLKADPAFLDEHVNGLDHAWNGIGGWFA